MYSACFEEITLSSSISLSIKYNVGFIPFRISSEAIKVLSSPPENATPTFSELNSLKFKYF